MVRRPAAALVCRRAALVLLLQLAQLAPPLVLLGFGGVRVFFALEPKRNQSSRRISSGMQFPLNRSELLDCKLQVCAAVCSRELHADTSLTSRYDGVGEANNIDSFLQ